jgi:cytochrome c oxidase subunit IV
MLIGGWIAIYISLIPLVWGGLLVLTGVLWLITSFKNQNSEGFGYISMIEILVGLTLNGLITSIIMGGL